MDYLRCEEDGLLNPALRDHKGYSDIAIGAHIILCHSFLDRLLDAFGIQGPNSLQMAPRRQFVDFNSGKYAKALGALKDWQIHINRALKAIEDNARQGEADNRQIFASQVENPTAEQRRLMNAASNLARGATRLRHVEAALVALNMELLAFAIVWYGEASEFILHIC